MIVLGGGFIAAELGYFFGELGTEVEFVVRSCLLRKEDIDVRKEFTRVFRKRWNVHTLYAPRHVRYDHEKNMFHVKMKHLETGEEMEHTADALLVAHGIQPNTDDLCLHNTSIEVDPKGFIRVDDHLRTTAPGVWALGDCIGRYQYRHTVNLEGEYLFRSVFQTPSGACDPLVYSHIPHAVFSLPQIGAVGKTEDQMREEGADYVVAINTYAASAMGMALKSEHGFVKLVVHRSTRKIVGGHVIGPQASTMVHIIAAFMYFQGTVDDMVKMIWAHPALPEVIRNAAKKAVQSLEQ
jgi:mycothione reductase